MVTLQEIRAGVNDLLRAIIFDISWGAFSSSPNNMKERIKEIKKTVNKKKGMIKTIIDSREDAEKKRVPKLLKTFGIDSPRNSNVTMIKDIDKLVDDLILIANLEKERFSKVRLLAKSTFSLKKFERVLKTRVPYPEFENFFLRFFPKFHLDTMGEITKPSEGNTMIPNLTGILQSQKEQLSKIRVNIIGVKNAQNTMVRKNRLNSFIESIDLLEKTTRMEERAVAETLKKVKDINSQKKFKDFVDNIIDGIAIRSNTKIAQYFRLSIKPKKEEKVA